jgi:hypothetical protein
MSIPQIGDLNVRGFVLPDTCGHTIEALESLYGNQKPDGYNPLLFMAAPGETIPPVGTEVLFDCIASPWGSSNPPNGAVAGNIRIA